MSFIKKILSSSITSQGKWYFLAEFVSKGVIFLLTPIYTTYLTQQEYGVVGALQSITIFIPILIALYTDSAFARFFHDCKTAEEKKELLSTVINFTLLLSVLVFTGFAILYSLNLIPVAKGQNLFLVIAALLPSVFLQLNVVFGAYYEQSLRPKRKAIYEGSGAVVLLVLAVVFLKFMNLGLPGYIAAILIAYSFISISYFIHYATSGLFTFTLNTSLLKKLLAYSLPVVPNFVALWVNQYFGRLFLLKHMDTSAVGIYTLAFNIGMIPYIVHNIITQTFGPILMSELVKDKDTGLKKLFGYSMIVLYTMVAVVSGTIILSKILVLILGKASYMDAILYIPIIAGAYIMGAQYRLFQVIVSYHKKTIFITMGGILSSLACIGFNLYYMPVYGLYAAALSVFVSYLIYSIWIISCVVYFERQYFTLPVLLKYVSHYALAQLIVWGVYYLSRQLLF